MKFKAKRSEGLQVLLLRTDVVYDQWVLVTTNIFHYGEIQDYAPSFEKGVTKLLPSQQSISPPVVHTEKKTPGFLKESRFYITREKKQNTTKTKKQ